MPGVVRRAMLNNRLLQHDLLILAATFKGLFSKFQDLAAVALVAALPILLSRGALWSLNPDKRLLVWLGVASLAALSLDIALLNRLRYFRFDSPLSAAASLRRARVGYRFAMHLGAGIPTACVLCLPDASATLAFVLTWWISLLPVQLVTWAVTALTNRASPRRFEAFIRAWRSRIGGRGALPATVAGMIVIFLVGQYARPELALIVAIAVSFCVLFWYSPVDYEVVNFERICGHSPSRSLRAGLQKPAAIGAALCLAAIASGTPMSGPVLGLTAGVLGFRFLGILLSRILARHQVQFSLAVALLVILSVAMPALWAAPLIVLVFSAWLLMKARRTTWVLQ